MKKILLFAFFLLLLVTVFSCKKDNGKVYEREGFIYKKTENGIEICGFTGTDRFVTIPDEIESVPVVSVSERAFYGCVCLEEIVIPDSITVISYAFENCHDLKKATIGAGVREMESAFKNCDSLSSAEGYENAEIMTEAFEGCILLTECRIPKTALDCENAFKGCESLKSVTVFEGITELKGTFSQCVSLKKIKLSKTVTSLVSTFSGCRDLSEVDGLENVTEYINTFEDCISLVSVSMGRFVTDVCGAFTGCTSLIKVVDFPCELETYAPSFGMCRSISYIHIPSIRNDESERTYRPADDFKGCLSLKTVVIDCECNISDTFCDIFADCASLESVTVPDRMLESILYPGYIVSDKIYDGDETAVLNLLKKYGSSPTLRVNEGYGFIDGVSYSHINGSDLYCIDPEEYLSEVSVTDMKNSEHISYWIGFRSDETDSKREIIERLFFFCPIVTGNEKGKLPAQIYINGKECFIG